MSFFWFFFFLFFFYRQFVYGSQGANLVTKAMILDRLHSFEVGISHFDHYKREKRLDNVFIFVSLSLSATMLPHQSHITVPEIGKFRTEWMQSQ